MHKSNTHAAFIVTKPIQLLVVLAVLEQEVFHKKVTLFFCDSFINAQNVERRFRRAINGRMHSCFCKSRIHAINLAAGKGFDVLYVDSDVGVQHYIALLRFKLRNPFCLVNVFEEGLGTYNEDAYTGLKKVILKTLGVGGNFGGNIFTTNIYVYKPDEYIAKFQEQRKKAKLIETSIWSLIGINSELFKKTFNIINHSGAGDKNSFCYVYLTGHLIDYDFINKFKIKDGQLFIKYHPHLKNIHQIEGIEALNSSAPVECIIHEFLHTYDNIVIYDHYSAARRYVIDPRVSFKLINEL